MQGNISIVKIKQSNVRFTYNVTTEFPERRKQLQPHAVKYTVYII